MQSDDFPELVTPADVEREMAELNRRISEAPTIIKRHHNIFLEARQEHKIAYALAYARADGTQVDRKMQAELETQVQREALDRAQIEYTFVRDTLDSLKTKLRALQSIGSMLRAEMFGQQGGV